MSVIRRANFGLRSFNPRQAPTVPVEVNWQHPLTRGLLSHFIFTARDGGLTDLCGNLGKLTVAGSAISPSANGPGYSSVPIDSYLYSGSVPAAFKSTTEASLFWLGTWVSDASAYGEPMLGVLYDNAVSSPFHCYSLMDFSADGSGVNNRLSLALNIGGGGQPPNIDVARAFGPQVAIATFQFGSTGKLYNNDHLAGTFSIAGAPPAYTATSTFVVNGFNAALGRSGGKITNAVASWNRALTADEALWLNSEPFVMVRPIVRRRFYLPSTVVAAPAGKRPRITMVA